MKQHITELQVEELSKAQMKTLSNFLGFKSRVINLKHYLSESMTIGQMIEFIQEHNGFKSYGDMYTFNYSKKGELCDSLWKSVKEIL